MQTVAAIARPICISPITDQPILQNWKDIADQTVKLLRLLNDLQQTA